MSATTPLNPLRDFGDYFSPIVVKELRQGLRTRFFSSALMLFHTFIILLLTSVLLGAPMEAVNGIFWGSAGLMLLVVLPLRAFNALNAEAAEGTLDMLTLTSISSFRIVQGKWMALFSQALLVAGSLLPYMVARYFFGGVEIVREVLALVILSLGCGIVTAALLAFSSQPSVLLRLALMTGTGFAAVPLGFFTAFLVTASQADFMLREFFALEGWQQGSIVGGIIAVAAYLIWYLLALGASRIAPPSENHSTRKRIIVFSVHGALLVIGLLLCWLSDPDHGLWPFVPLFGLTLLVCMDVLTEEMPRFPTAIAALAKRAPWGRLAGRLLHPGWASGVFFAALLCGMPMVLLAAIGRRSLSGVWENGPGLYFLCALLAAFVPAVIRIRAAGIFTSWWLVQICIAAAGFILVIFGGTMGSAEVGILGVFTPLTALFCVEMLEYSTRHSAILTGSACGLLWLAAAMGRACKHFAAYRTLEEAARRLPAAPAPPPPPPSHDAAE